jgi:hypothetical protein
MSFFAGKEQWGEKNSNKDNELLQKSFTPASIPTPE